MNIMDEDNEKDNVEERKIRVQTFGSFEVFADGKPLSFKRSKTKELFAYLVYKRGAWCSNNELIVTLWEDKENNKAAQDYLRQLVSDLSSALKSAGFGGILLKKRSMLAVMADRVDCEYIDVFNGDTHAIYNYTGEFMAQYSWAELVNAYLNNIFLNTYHKTE